MIQKSILVLYLLGVYLNLVRSFNLDTFEPIYKQASLDNSDADNGNIFFGYSIAQHLVRSNNTSYLLVGAPKDSVTRNGKLYNHSGAIYKCPITLNSIDDCDLIDVNFDMKSSDEGNL